MQRVLLCFCVVCAVIALCATGAMAADRDSYMRLARSGWSYELRSSMMKRDMSIPVHINGRDLAGAALCIVGDPPNAQTTQVLTAFSDLARHVFGRPLPMRYAGTDVALCGPRRTVILRLYSGYPPNADLTRDMVWLDKTYELGLPGRRVYAATSPGQAQTFFGRRGAATHILVQQAPVQQAPVQQGLGDLPEARAAPLPDPLPDTYFRSILIEELYQSFTFGMDIVMLRRQARFLSKLQEVPLNLHRLPWGSRAFMAALVSSNPSRLCAFDVFMMHAVAQAPVDQTTDPAFLDFIDAEFARLDALSAATLADGRFATVLDPACQAHRF